MKLCKKMVLVMITILFSITGGKVSCPMYGTDWLVRKGMEIECHPNNTNGGQVVPEHIMKASSPHPQISNYCTVPAVLVGNNRLSNSCIR
jgi:hypothetical protein